MSGARGIGSVQPCAGGTASAPSGSPPVARVFGCDPADTEVGLHGAGRRQYTVSGRAHPPRFPLIERHNTAIIVLITVDTPRRRPLLNNASVHSWLRSCWLEAADWVVGRYVLMPDHLHLFCAPGRLIILLS